ncbi:MAG: sodium/solute symporter [Bacteroidota bacterium]
MSFTTTDFIFFGAYILFIIVFAIWISNSKKDGEETTESYFLAGKSLPWWIIGGSLIASNISAEQFIGMSGDGFLFGLGIATYEFMAAATLILVAWFMLPIYLKKGIYTMPQFVEKRFDGNVRTGLAIFWLLIFVFVNITSVLYLGALTMEKTLGINIYFGVIGLAIYSATFSIFGGLRTVVWTDLIQVVFLVLGGLFTTYFALDQYGEGQGFMTGLSKLYENIGDRFNMILDKGEVIYTTPEGETKDAWEKLPGLSVLIGGMWIANLYYWGMNQYIIQRALAAKNITEARKGVAFAAFMKLLLPLIVVLPGMVAYAMKADLDKSDQVYSWVLNEFIGTGFKGICFAAVVAAVGSSISSMVNSASTIFTLDIYKPLIKKGASEEHLVRIGKITAAASLIIGIAIAPQFKALESAFSFIQKYTGYFSPGILVVFLFGLFWKRTSAKAAMWVVLLSLPLSLGLDISFSESVLPFMNKMGVSFLILSAVVIAISMIQNQGDDEKAIQLDNSMFKVDPIFRISSILVFGILSAIYALMW